SAAVENLTIAVSDGIASSTLNYIFSPTGAASTLVSTSGNDVIIGGAGSDTYLFPPNFGHDQNKNYSPGTDVLQFDHTIFAEAAAALAATQDVGGHAVITVDANHTVDVLGVLKASLHLNDFQII